MFTKILFGEEWDDASKTEGCGFESRQEREIYFDEQNIHHFFHLWDLFFSVFTQKNFISMYSLRKTYLFQKVCFWFVAKGELWLLAEEILQNSYHLYKICCVFEMLWWTTFSLACTYMGIMYTQLQPHSFIISTCDVRLLSYSSIVGVIIGRVIYFNSPTRITSSMMREVGRWVKNYGIRKFMLSRKREISWSRVYIQCTSTIIVYFAIRKLSFKEW